MSKIAPTLRSAAIAIKQKVAVRKDVEHDEGHLRNELDFNLVCSPFTEIVTCAHVPVTVALLYIDGKTYRKVLLGTTLPNRTPPTSETSQIDLGSEEVDVENEVPEALRMPEPERRDTVGGSTVFAIGSLSKPLVALACCKIIENGEHKGLQWSTPIFKFLREHCDMSVPISEAMETNETTVEDILLHRNALPDLNHLLLLADGTFQVNDEEFVEYLERAACDSSILSRRNKTNIVEYEYSNANTVLISILLMKLEKGKTINEILKKHVLIPLGMHRTALSKSALDDMITEAPQNVATGYRISSDLVSHSPAPAHDYLDCNISAVTLGVRSSVDDIAKLYRALCEAMDGRTDFITRAVIQRFFEITPSVEVAGLLPAHLSFAGLAYNGPKLPRGVESLNHVVRQRIEPGQGESSEQHPGKPSLTYYKGGTVDGFTGTVYFHLPSRMFAVVLSNGVGPMDVTEIAARYLIQAAIQANNGGDTSDLVEVIKEESRKQLQQGCRLWQQLEKEDADTASWSSSLQPYVGNYQHKSHEHEMKITFDGKAYFSRRGRLLTIMEIRASNSELRLFPVSKGLYVDRLTTFRNPTFTIEKHGPRIVLCGNERKDKYLQLLEG